RPRPRNPEHVDRPGPRPDLAQTGADGPRRHRPGHPGGLERIVPPGQARREHGGVRASGSVGRAGGMTLARELDQTLAVEVDVDGLLAMAAGEDHDPRPEPV